MPKALLMTKGPSQGAESLCWLAVCWISRSKDTTERLERIFLEDLARCREVTREVYESRSLWVRVREQASRLLSPLL